MLGNLIQNLAKDTQYLEVDTLSIFLLHMLDKWFSKDQIDLFLGLYVPFL
jgi:hypothetical protein